ncbi:MAG: hypothetical protein M1839_002988 [Geoglossum umbratile]|nr:MAG: hypothetical protein M1839_002988 [Geoglossum umbratile]
MFALEALGQLWGKPTWTTASKRLVAATAVMDLLGPVFATAGHGSKRLGVSDQCKINVDADIGGVGVRAAFWVQEGFLVLIAFLDSCRCHELWQYVDPDTLKEELPKLTAPLEPQYADYDVDATRLADLSSDDRISYRWDYECYERLQTTYKKTVQALADFNLKISKTVGGRYLYLIQDCDTAHN